MIVGDNRNYLTVLLTLKVEVDPVTALPTDKLDTRVVEWCRSLGVYGVRSIEDFRTNPKKQVSAHVAFASI